MVMYQEQVHHTSYTERLLDPWYLAVMARTSMQTATPVSSTGDLQSPRPLDTIHSTSPRGRQEDEEISSGGIQTRLTLLPATSSPHKALHIWATFKFPLAAMAELACGEKNSSDIQLKILQKQDSIFTVHYSY